MSWPFTAPSIRPLGHALLWTPCSRTPVRRTLPLQLDGARRLPAVPQACHSAHPLSGISTAASQRPTDLAAIPTLSLCLPHLGLFNSASWRQFKALLSLFTL